MEDELKAAANDDAGAICFGLDRATDEASLAAFLRLFARPELTRALIPRLDGAEIEAIVDLLTRTMGRHLGEDEYHCLFLGEETPS